MGAAGLEKRLVFNQCYFISWLGKFREERLALLHEAVEWAKSHNFSVRIIAMEWKAEEYAQFPGVVFNKIPGRLPPAHARNIALNIFYASDHDLCLILDDDTYIAEGADVIDLLRTQMIDGMVYSVRDSVLPRVECEKHRFERPSQITSGVFIVRQKANVFFNPEFKYYNEELLWGEDANFLGRVYDKGMRAYEIVTARTNKSRERDITPSTWYRNEEFFQTRLHFEINKRDFTNRVQYIKGNMICTDPAPAFEV